MITNYTHDELGSFRVIKEGQGTTWVCAKDVCDNIGLTNATLTVQVRIANGLMSDADRAMLGDSPTMLYINKTGVQAVATTTRKKHRDKAMAVSQYLMKTVFESEQEADEVTDAPQQEVFDFEEIPTEEVATQSDIQTFEHPLFGAIRTVTDENGETLWNASDVCNMLGYENAPDAIKRHVYFSDIVKRYTTKSVGGRLMLYVNESGLNALILGSKLPQAQEIKHWITSEVMVSIRKHGIYMTQQTAESLINNPDLIISLATQVKAERAEKERLKAQTIMLQQEKAELKQDNEEKKQLIEAQAGKVRFADAFHDSPEDISMSMMARILENEGIRWKKQKIGSNGLFEWMRRHHQCFYEWYYGSKCNVPEQTAINRGLLTTRMIPIEQLDDQLKPQTFVTAKGRVYYLELFRKLKGDHATYNAYYDEFDENGKALSIKELLNKEQPANN